VRPSDLRFTAARHALGVASSHELVEAADAALAQGIYSYSLGELATASSVVMADVGPLFVAALKELAIPLPPKDVAIRTLLRRYCEEIVEGGGSPLPVLGRGMQELHWRTESELNQLLDSSGGCELIDMYGAYDELEGLAEFRNSQEIERLWAETDRETVERARKWLRTHSAPRIDLGWLRWNDGTALKIARGIVEERAFGRLPILHDALIDAGCDNEDLLTHLREANEHGTSCWVVDLLLNVE
jgi:hypothetical protein